MKLLSNKEIENKLQEDKDIEYKRLILFKERADKEQRELKVTIERIKEERIRLDNEFTNYCDGLLATRLNLESEVLKLEEEKRRLLKPLIEEKLELQNLKDDLNSFRDQLDFKNNKVKKDNLIIDNRLRELDKKEINLEKQAIFLYNEEKKLKEDIKNYVQEKSKLVEDQQIFYRNNEEREKNLSIREAKARIEDERVVKKEIILKEKEMDLIKRERQLKDKYETLARSLKHLKK